MDVFERMKTAAAGDWAALRLEADFWQMGLTAVETHPQSRYSPC